MKLATQIRTQIAQFDLGKSFGYADLGIDKKDYATAAKALERLQKAGSIRKIAKGIFYKPEQTVFGELQPDYQEQLRPYLYENGKRIAYITGVWLYNRLGLTTQVPYRIKIASYQKRISINRDRLKADAVKSYAEVTEENYEVLGLLDAFKDIKKIPDCSAKQAFTRLKTIVNGLSTAALQNLATYALNYPPRVRALLGAILAQQEALSQEIDLLKDSLNPFTKFKLGFDEQDLENPQSWNIV
jgi:hypothetical protein